jgi:DNA-binding beta-propeller fold protein YncE
VHLRLATAAALVLLGCACASAQTAEPKLVQHAAARLVLQTYSYQQRGGMLLQPIDPDTLADDPTVEPLDIPGCATGLVVDPSGRYAVAATGATGWRDCGDASSAAVQVLDLRAWSWRAPIALADPHTLRLDASDRWPLAWSADGDAVYTLTVPSTPPEQRKLWRLDPTGARAPQALTIDYVPQRLDVAPNGSALFVLGGQSQGNSRQGAAVPGSAFVAIYDPKTLVERVRVPLSGLNLGAPENAPGTLIPGVAVAPDGSRYYVAHADRPALDVVDTRAPKLERLERRLSLREAPSSTGTRAAWLGVSRDGSRLFAWRRAESIGDELGLQMIDTRTWQVVTIDAIAQRMGWSVDGRFAFALDPPASLRPGATRPDNRGPRDATGARLSVLDATGHTELALLSNDYAPVGVSQFGADRVLVSHFERHFTSIQVFDTRTWTEVARRQIDTLGQLAGARSVW